MVLPYCHSGSYLATAVGVLGSPTFRPLYSKCHFHAVRDVEFLCDIQWRLSQEVDVAGSFRNSPNSMESMMCNSMSRSHVHTLLESELFVGEIPALEQVGLNEDDIRKAHKMDTVATLKSLRLFPNDLSTMRIPLYRLVPMPMVRPTLASDILALEQQFVYGYEEGARVFYVSIADEQSCTWVFSKTEKQD